MANVNIQLGYKDSAWFAANATLVLLAGQVVYLQQTGQYKIGNGVTQLSVLAFLGSSVIATETQLVTATVVNKTGVNLLASNYQAVKVANAQGQRLAVNFAQANNDNNSADTIGLVRENISNNQEGDVVILGQIIDVNTTGSLQGETWADGDVLYLSPTVAGRITNIKPTGATGHTVVIGYIEYSHVNHGKIFVKIMNGWELEELHNVSDTSYTTPINADSLLIKDSTASLWKRLTWANLKTLIFTIPSLVSQAAGVAITGVQWVLGSKQWIGGNITTQKEIELTSPSYSFTTSSTITNAYSMYVNAPTASTNATITNNYALGLRGQFIADFDGTNKFFKINDWSNSFNTYGWGIQTHNNQLRLPNTLFIGDINYQIGRFKSIGDPIADHGGSFMPLKDFKAGSQLNTRIYVYGRNDTGNVGIGTAIPTERLHVSGGNLLLEDAGDIVLGTTSGTKIGTATNQKISFWNATPIVQPTTAITSSTIVNGTGTASKQDDTFDGYTMAQVVKALRNIGILQ